MSALFPKHFNTVARLSVAIAAGVPAVAIASLLLYVRTPFGTGTNHPHQQPVQFDHRHHVIDVGLDCRFCHFAVEEAATAGIPDTQVCMGCHSQIWNKSPLLDTVRDAYFKDQPIAWKRVHNLPDFAYFDHSIHVNKGVGCASCHGRVDQMASVEQVSSLTMGWCLDCHRNPGPHLRPKDQITNMDWSPPTDPEEAVALGQKLIEEYDVHPRTSCSACHR